MTIVGYVTVDVGESMLVIDQRRRSSARQKRVETNFVDVGIVHVLPDGQLGPQLFRGLTADDRGNSGPPQALIAVSARDWREMFAVAKCWTQNRSSPILAVPFDDRPVPPKARAHGHTQRPSRAHTPLHRRLHGDTHGCAVLRRSFLENARSSLSTAILGTIVLAQLEYCTPLRN